jgi:disulfide bond formation protein DsbB
MEVTLLVTVGMAMLTLFFEYVAGFEPCMLCWWQRVFMFPQIILLGLALWKKEADRIIDYCLALSFLGFLVGVYNYALLYMPSLAPCSATGVSCAKVHFVSFGFVTFPLWAITGFVLVISLLLLQKHSNKK